MKVNIGRYKSYFGPYQLAEFLCFWTWGDKDEPDYVFKFGEWLAHGSIEPELEVGEIEMFGGEDRHDTLLHKLLSWIDSKKKRKINVRIDRWDTYSLDSTLAYIILPSLLEIKKDQRGTPYVSDFDVPFNLHCPEEENTTGDIDANWVARWDYVLDEMIFAFESQVDTSWQDQFYGDMSGGLAFKKLENGHSEMITIGTMEIDHEGKEKYQKRIDNGLLLFGKYYQSLWT
jgi:hypothetical protein